MCMKTSLLFALIFDEAYEEIDWSDFEQLPAFEEANRRNAYQVYLSLEAEMLGNP